MGYLNREILADYFKSTYSELLGIYPEKAIKNILKRAVEREKSLEKQSGLKTGLVVQGGTMRGILSGGPLIALDELGLRNAFDTVYASSAGSINSAYFLTGQAAYGGTIYYQDINNKKFINILRLRMILNLDYLKTSIMKSRKRLNTKKLRSFPTPLHIATTKVSTGQYQFHSTHNPEVNIIDTLWAGAAMPLLYGKSMIINREMHIDGGLANPIPLFDAIKAGCTDILVLLTIPIKKSTKVALSDKLSNQILRPRLNKLSRNILEAWDDRPNRIEKVCSILRNETIIKDLPNIVAIVPDFPSRISRTTKNEIKLKLGLTRMAFKTFKLFAPEKFNSEVPEVGEIIRFLN